MNGLRRLLLALLVALPTLAASAAPHDEVSPEAETEIAAASHGPARGLMDVKASEMIYTIIVFGIFFVVLSTVVWPKILAGLKAREDKQRRDLQDAEKASAEATHTLAQYKQQLADAQKEALRIIDDSRAAAVQVAAKVKADTEREIAQLRERTSKEITAAKESALADIYEQAAVMSTQIAGRILKRELNPQDQQGLVTESLQQIQASNN